MELERGHKAASKPLSQGCTAPIWAVLHPQLCACYTASEPIGEAPKHSNLHWMQLRSAVLAVPAKVRIALSVASFANGHSEQFLMVTRTLAPGHSTCFLVTICVGKHGWKRWSCLRAMSFLALSALGSTNHSFLNFPLQVVHDSLSKELAKNP